MKSSKIFAIVAVALLSVALCTVAVGQDQATAQEVVAKVREAASALSKTGDLAQFNQKQGPWVWKDTYIFIQDCDKKIMAAHPIKPELVGQELIVGRGHQNGKEHLPGPRSTICKKVQETRLWHLERLLVAEARRGAGPSRQAQLSLECQRDSRTWLTRGFTATRQPSRNCQS
jgi:hypothetical protein